MSSDGSETSTGSRIRQFGLYRTIDARTDEFLKASKKRQIRQGCACAAISTAITVTVVIVIILIYEYAIAVEWTSVQNRNKHLGTVSDQPHADKLDRTIFGFDQEYFERMPLLINALQERNYVDHTLEVSGALNKKKRFNVTIEKNTKTSTLESGSVRRGSPRPFYFELRHPTPIPFSKTYASRRWIEQYRNEERLKNIRQIIKYLESTINAKVGDMHARPADKEIAFTGLYVEPMLENRSLDNDSKLDLQPASSNNLPKFHLNHLTDPLFNFKPENPGDVNLLADNIFRFSPASAPKMFGEPIKYPMFRQIPFQTNNCQGNKCENSNGKDKSLHNSVKSKPTESPTITTTKSFSVMLNLYQVTHKPKINGNQLKASTPIEKIYFTTSRPLMQFKRKPNKTVRRTYTPYKRPRYLINLINNKFKANKTKETKVTENTSPDTQMIVHVQIYDDESDTKNETVAKNSTTFKPSIETHPYTSKAPIELSTSEIGDFHIGSSGYIPVVTQIDNSMPKVTTTFPFIDTTTEYWNSLTSQSTQVLKFDANDAKIPSQYVNLHNNINAKNIEYSRRNSKEFVERQQLLQEMNTNAQGTQTSTKNYEELKTTVKPSTLAIKLNNDENKVTTTIEVNEKETTTTSWTYVPQTNGHYRSIIQNSNDATKRLDPNLLVNRKKRLEISVSGFQNYAPKYVEIKRNNTNVPESEEDMGD